MPSCGLCTCSNNWQLKCLAINNPYNSDIILELYSLQGIKQYLSDEVMWKMLFVDLGKLTLFPGWHFLVEFFSLSYKRKHLSLYCSLWYEGWPRYRPTQEFLRFLVWLESSLVEVMMSNWAIIFYFKGATHLN